MKFSYPVLKYSLILLIFVTLAAFIATILEDAARDNSYHIVLYIVGGVALVVAIMNSSIGWLTLQEARGIVQPVFWYKNYRLTYGIFMLLVILSLLYWYGLSSKFPHEIEMIVTIMSLVVLGIPSLIFSILTTVNKSQR